ncbi:MAG: hypothetical protein V3T58_02770 [Candidatus Hydrothermarchaeales archaeon]
MDKVMSVRLTDDEVIFIEKIAKKKNRDKSTIARELIDQGKTLWVFNEYQEGRLSLENAALELGISISELLDLLARYGIRSPVQFEDYLKGLEIMEKEKV